MKSIFGAGNQFSVLCEGHFGGGIVAVDVDVFWGERELKRVLDDVLVKLVVEE